MVSIIQANIFETRIDGVCHVVDCHSAWKDPINKQIRMRCPRAHRADTLILINNPKKLSTFSFAAPDELQPIWVFNLAGQFNYGKDKIYVDYTALCKSMEACRDFIFKLDKKDFKLGIPYGIGTEEYSGGDWSKIIQIINYVFEKEDSIQVLICKNLTSIN